MTEPVRLTDFMCVCTNRPRMEAEACLARVYRDLKCGPTDLLSAVVYALEWGLPYGFLGSITGIGCDQWCGVGARVLRLGAERYEEFASIYVQCDVAEHGVARVWELALRSTQVPGVRLTESDD